MYTLNTKRQMIPEDFKDYFTNCSKTVQGQIVNTLLSLSDASTSKSDLQEKLPTICPHCSAKEVIANGRLSGVQRFRCKNCGKNFSETTRKVWYNLKKKDQAFYPKDEHRSCFISLLFRGMV